MKPPVPRLVLLADGRALIGILDDPEPDLARPLTLHQPALLMITPIPVQTQVGGSAIGTVPVLHVLDVPAVQVRSEHIVALSVGDGAMFAEYLDRTAKRRLLA